MEYLQKREFVYQWRGPFKAIQQGRRGKWAIVNAAGAVERVGFTHKGSCAEVARLMNLAKAQCEEIDVPPASARR